MRKNLQPVKWILAIGIVLVGGGHLLGNLLNNAIILWSPVELPDVRPTVLAPDPTEGMQRLTACTNLHAMIAAGPWFSKNRYERVLMAPPDYQQQVTTEADRWGCEYY